MASHTIFFRLSVVFVAAPLMFGINGLLRPAAHRKSLGFPEHTEIQANKLNQALMRIWGVRNLCVGLLLSFIWSTGDEKLMGKGLLAGMTMPIMDGFVSRGLIGGGTFQHWVFPPIMSVMVAGLFGYFD